MTRQIVPLQAVPNQTLQVQLDGQPCIINLYQTAYALFIDLYVGNSLIACGVICENLNRIVRYAYRGFVGDLAFVDTQGSTDPVYTGLGSRYQLLYFDENALSNDVEEEP
jgi:hypothetical protein